MTQTIAILLRFREEAAEEFESMFEAHIFPMWQEIKAAGKFVKASLSSVVDGSELVPGLRETSCTSRCPLRKSMTSSTASPRFKRS